MTAIRSSVPRHLVAKVPPMLLMSLSLRTFWNIFGVGLGLLLLYGPITGINQDHNGLRYLLGPLIGPTVALSFLLLCPFNPYRGSAARLSGMENRDKWDPEARRLVELFRSNAARRFLVTSSMKISCVLYLFMVPGDICMLGFAEVASSFSMAGPGIAGMFDCNLYNPWCPIRRLGIEDMGKSMRFWWRVASVPWSRIMLRVPPVPRLWGPGMNDARLTTDGSHLDLLKPKIRPDHRLRRVRKRVCRCVELRQIRSLVEVPAILKSQSDVRK
jgi:hypothetical protein